VIERIALTMQATGPGIDEAKFQEIANAAKLSSSEAIVIGGIFAVGNSEVKNRHMGRFFTGANSVAHTLGKTLHLHISISFDFTNILIGARHLKQ